MDTQEARPEHYAGSSDMVKEAAESAAAVVAGFEHAPRKAERTTHRKSSYDRGVQIAAAKLRVATDRRIGEATPDWIKALAAEKPTSHAS